ncbi:MAG: hypothetical protein HGA43_17725, partial [Nitrospirae bacterium]|nr:hypothetical protein [Nitrospirota bacterium]
DNLVLALSYSLDKDGQVINHEKIARLLNQSTPVPVYGLHEEDLNEIVQSVTKIAKRLIGEDIEFRTVLRDKSMNVLADSGQMEQVLLNLCTNARDAMPHGGQLIIETDLVEFDERPER